MKKVLAFLLLAGFGPVLGTTPASADPVACVGRFSQTLSVRQDRCRGFWERQIDLSELVGIMEGSPCPCFDLNTLRTTPPPDDRLNELSLMAPTASELLCLDDGDRTAVGRGRLEPFEFVQMAAAGLSGSPRPEEDNLAAALVEGPSITCILNGERGESKRLGQDIAEGEAMACQDIIRQYAALAEVECIPPPEKVLAER